MFPTLSIRCIFTEGESPIPWPCILGTFDTHMKDEKTFEEIDKQAHRCLAGFHEAKPPRVIDGFLLSPIVSGLGSVSVCKYCKCLFVK